MPCAADAIIKAEVAFAFSADLRATDPVVVQPTVKMLPPIKALKGNGHFDVLEVTGHYIKATYRMHFIYAQIKGPCAMMGQEILEANDPY